MKFSANNIIIFLFLCLVSSFASIAKTQENNYLKIIVQNPFDPETSQPLKGTGFGLSSVQRRLFLLFARQDLLTTQKNEAHFTTTILIPQTI